MKPIFIRKYTPEKEKNADEFFNTYQEEGKELEKAFKKAATMVSKQSDQSTHHDRSLSNRPQSNRPLSNRPLSNRQAKDE